jgi:hypothetical protein
LPGGPRVPHHHDVERGEEPTDDHPVGDGDTSAGHCDGTFDPVACDDARKTTAPGMTCRS